MKPTCILIVVLASVCGGRDTRLPAAFGQSRTGALPASRAPCLPSGEVPRQVADRRQVRHAAVRMAGHERAKSRL